MELFLLANVLAHLLVITKVIALLLALFYTPALVRGVINSGITVPFMQLMIWAVVVTYFITIQFKLYV